MTATQFPCSSCGAKLEFSPGVENLQCPYCGTVNIIERLEEDIQEEDIIPYLENLADSEEVFEAQTVTCGSCQAESTLDPHVTAEECPFCGAPLVGEAHTKRLIRPRYVLPFKVTDKEALEGYKGWLKGLWFTPRHLKTRARVQGGVQGLYVPYWTFDAETVSHYRGQRGDYYYETETYVENGQTKTRQVRRTAWRSASGVVDVPFDDILIQASHSLPDKHLQALKPWDLDSLTGYRDEFLSGFRAEAYQVELPDAFTQAQGEMENPIRQAIRMDIGGDEQRIETKETAYHQVTFKHILLPVWINAFRFKNKVYRFLVNARTGEVRGERPYSALKITGLILGILLVVGVVGYFWGR